MKKLIALMLALVLVFSLTACTGGTQPQNTETTVVGSETNGEQPATGLTGEITVQAETSWMEYYNKVVEEFIAKNPNAKVTVLESGAFDHLDKIDSTDILNPDVADVFAIPLDRLYSMNQNSLLASINAPAIAAMTGGYEDYDASFGGSFKVDGEYLAFPMNIETLVAFVNTKNAAAEGLDLTKKVELNDLAAEVMLVPAFNAWFGVALTNPVGLELLGKDGEGKLFSDLTADWKDLPAEKQELFQALYKYWKVNYDAKNSLWDKDAVWGYMDESFKSGGKTAIRIDGPWSTGSLSALAGEGADLDIRSLADLTINGKSLAHWQSGWGIAVNARVEDDAEKLALSEAFIAELLNIERAVSFFESTGKIMPNVTKETYLSSSLDDSNKMVIGAVIDSYKEAVKRPLFTEWSQVWSTWENSLLSWSSVKPATPEAAYAEVQAAFKAMMSQF